MTKPSIIYFGNGPLSDAVLPILEKSFNIIFHAREKADLATVKSLKLAHPEAHGILASFGVLIKSDILDLFEPEGILNIHPSLLPLYRGSSPIESTILAGDTDFSVSIMKLAPAMDAGPIFYQTTLKNLPQVKSEIYSALATTGAKWLVKNLENLPTPTPQDNSKATFCGKFDKSMSLLRPDQKPSTTLLREIIAFANFPKSKYTLNNIDCTIHSAHIESSAPSPLPMNFLPCTDGNFLVIDELQPAGKRPMSWQAFKNGYLR